MNNSPKEQKVILEKVKCREILSEIINFGVNQNQIKTLIGLLALELEDRELMVYITQALSNDIEVKEKPQIKI
tara:strand:- start:72 stop:290 length:219 start_codon:yes stop_codon:yes gene_type:complete